MSSHLRGEMAQEDVAAIILAAEIVGVKVEISSYEGATETPGASDIYISGDLSVIGPLMDYASQIKDCVAGLKMSYQALHNPNLLLNEDAEEKDVLRSDYHHPQFSSLDV